MNLKIAKIITFIIYFIEVTWAMCYDIKINIQTATISDMLSAIIIICIVAPPISYLLTEMFWRIYNV